MLNFENLDKVRFAGMPPYGIPEIQPEHINIRHLEWIPFNYAKTAEAYTVKPAGGIAKKITCQQCGKRRYGVAYQIEKK